MTRAASRRRLGSAVWCFQQPLGVSSGALRRHATPPPPLKPGPQLERLFSSYLTEVVVVVVVVDASLGAAALFPSAPNEVIPNATSSVYLRGGGVSGARGPSKDEAVHLWRSHR